MFVLVSLFFGGLGETMKSFGRSFSAVLSRFGFGAATAGRRVRLVSCALSFCLAICGLVVLPVACSEADCTDGTVRIVATVPAEVAAGVTAVDVSFAVAGKTIHSQRLLVPPGKTTVEADVLIPSGYPKGQRVVVTAVAKSGTGAGESAVATWFASEEFPSGCIGFVFTLFAGNVMDGGVYEGGALFSDALPVVDALRDSSTPDTAAVPDAAAPADTATDSLAAPPADTAADSSGADTAPL
jgi:hypothetical protein